MVSIGNDVFNDCYAITSIVIPNSVTTIGNNAFASCISLTSVVIPDSVTSIGNYAFSDCGNLSEVTLSKSLTHLGCSAFSGTALHSIEIPKTLVSCAVVYNLGYTYNGVEYSFAGGPFTRLDTLKQVSFEEGTTVIVGSLFEGCTGLEQIVIPDTVEVIHSSAFKHCLRLNSVTVGSGVKTIENNAFNSCISLPAIKLPNSLTTVGDSAFANCTGLTSVAISDSVTDIGNSVFASCSSLTSVVIPDSVTSIGNYAFSNCGNLSEVTLSKSLTKLGGSAFSGTALHSIEIPKTLVSCGVIFNLGYTYNGVEYSFAGGPFARLDTLKQVSFEEGTTVIPGSLFEGCTGLEQIVIPDTVEVIHSSAFKHCLRLNSVTVGSGVKTIENSAFNTCISLPAIKLPNSLTTVEDSVFANCTGLTSVAISDSVTNIGNSVFASCSSLTSVVIPDSVTSIGNYAFSNCGNLSEVTLSKSLTKLGGSAFSGTALHSIEIPKTLVSCGVIYNLGYTYNGVGYSFSGGPFAQLDTLKQVSFEEGTTVIAENLFAGCTGLEEVVIPDTVEVIHSSAFKHCLRLNSVTVGSGVKTIENNAFDVCVSLPAINLPDSLTTIGNYAFASCTNLTEIIFDGSAPSISNSAFSGVTATAYYPDDDTTWTTDVMQQYGGTLTWLPHCRIPGRVDSWSVSLSDDIQVNFYLKINEKIASTARVRIYVGDNSMTYLVSNMEKTEDGKYVARVSIAAAQMSDYILVTVLNCSHIGETQTYTVRQYADAILADESYSAYHALVQEMLNYGAAAQVYFDYETGNLANSGISGAGQVEVPDSVDEEVSVSGSADGVEFYGASLVFRNRIAVRYYFRFVGDITSCTFASDGTVCSPMLKDGLYYVEVADILPQDLDQQISLTVEDASGNTLTVRYSPMNYIVRMSENGNDSLKALLKALYNYHLAAESLQAA